MENSLQLENLAFLAVIEPELIKTLCTKAAVTRRLTKGDYLFKQGDIARDLYIIHKGNLKISTVSADGKEALLQLVGRGEILGASCICCQNAHLSSAIAIEDCRVCVLSPDRLEEVIAESPDLALQLICNLGTRLQHMSEQVARVRVGTTRDRIINLFNNLAAEHGEPCETGTKICLRLTQQDIADFIGVSRVMVAQVLKQLSISQYITRKNKYFIINHR